MKSHTPLAVIAAMTIITAAFGFATLAGAHPRPHQGRGNDGMMGPGRQVAQRMAEELELNDEQIAEIAALREAYRPSLEASLTALHQAQRALREAIREQVDNAAIDEPALAALGAQIGAAEVEMTTARARMQIEIHGKLTPEQLARAAELRAQRQDRPRPDGQGRRFHGRGPGGNRGIGAPGSE